MNQIIITNDLTTATIAEVIKDIKNSGGNVISAFTNKHEMDAAFVVEIDLKSIEAFKQKFFRTESSRSGNANVFSVSISLNEIENGEVKDDG